MTTLDRYILREQVVPFLFGFAIVTFLLSMDFIFDYLDLFITKGVPGLVVLELYVLGLGWMVAMSVPCAALVAPLMAYGRMAHDNEITALRAGGVHMLRIMRPALASSIGLAVLLTLFNNHVLPESNHAFANLMIDISRKKPALQLQAGVFINDLPGYSMLIEKVDPRTSEMEHITIYELKPRGMPVTIIARHGRLAYTNDGSTLIVHLRDGEIHEVPDPRQPQKYRRVVFENHTIYIKGVSQMLQRSRRDTRSDRERSSRDMLREIHTLEGKRHAVLAELDSMAVRSGARDFEELLAGLGEASALHWWQRLAAAAGSLIELGPMRQRLAVERAVEVATPADSLAAAATPADSLAAAATGGDSLAAGAAGGDPRPAPRLSAPDAALLRVKRVELKGIDRRIQSFSVEVHKKFAIPVACVVFVMVGAPLGIRARRGGIGVGFLSVVFFLFYYICLIGGEQLADRSILPPWLAMWIANVVIGGLGVLLTLRIMEVGKSGVRPAPPAPPAEESAP